MTKSSTFVLFVAIFLIGAILRFYALGSVPNGLYQDETAIGYNAYSILKTGKDEYGKPYPLYFKSFGDYKLPVYIYSTVASIKLFGLTPFAVRFPSALFGTLTLIMMYVLVRKLTRSESFALLSVLFLSFNPWHLHYSRATFEVSQGLFFFLLGTWCIAKSSEKRHGFFLMGVLSFLAAFYTYNLTRLLSPLLFLIVLCYFHRKQTLPRRRELIASLVVGTLGLLPFFRTFFSQGGFASSAGTLIFTSASVQAPLLEIRSYMIGHPILAKLFFNTAILTFWQYLANVYAYLSTDFFFIHGSPHGNHGIGNVGLFYAFELPLMVVGFLTYFRDKAKPFTLLTSWALAVVIVSSLTREAPHATRSFFLLFPLVIFSAKGFFTIVSQIRKTGRTHQVILFSAISVAVLINIVYYMASYYIRFPIAYAKAWRTADAQLSLYIKAHEKNYERIVIDDAAGFIYSSLLFYNEFSPSEFQETVKRLPDDSEGFSKVSSFGKYEIRNISDADFRKPKTLIITTPDKKPAFVPPLETFYYPKRPVVFAVKQEIMRFPIEDIAYVAVAGVPQ